MERLIFHVDVNSAFLSWVATRRVSLGEEDIRLIPSAIGGDREKRTGVIMAKSICSKNFGLKSGEPVAMALRTCPQIGICNYVGKKYEAQIEQKKGRIAVQNAAIRSFPFLSVITNIGYGSILASQHS